MTLTRTSRTRRRALLAGAYAGLVIAAGGWALVACRQKQTLPEKDVVLVVSGDTAGWITPCGCTVNQSGGLPRRGTYIAELAKSHDVLYADVGGVIDGTSPYHALKADAVLRGEQILHAVAQNLGAAELQLGPARLRELQQSTGIPFLSANASAVQGAVVAPPSRIVAAGTLRVAFIGVVSPAYATAEWQVEEPRQAILRAMEGIKGQYDRLIVLAYVNEADLDALARDLPEADAIIGGPTGQSIAPHRAGAGAIVASATRKGKFVIEAALEGGRQARVVELNASFANAADQFDNLSHFHAELQRRDFSASQTALAPAAARLAEFAGTESCRSCHAAEFAVWNSTGHAHAWESLVQKSTQFDPSCQVCHTTGYGAPGGFVSVASSVARVGVGCEDCHGPSLAHAKSPQVHTQFLAAAQCLSCHDEENSPQFNYQAAWPKIRHGSATATHAGEVVR